MPTQSVSSNPDVELVEQFDKVAEPLQTGQYSRSQAIENAMEMYVTILKAWDEAVGEPPKNEKERRLLTADAVLNRADYHEMMANG